MEKVLKFKWTVSKGRDTYGYNICSLYADGEKVSSCNGGNYDMQGTVLGDYIMAVYQDKLRKLPANYGSGDAKTGFYGLSFYNYKTKKQQHRWSKNVKQVYIDGGCGFPSVESIMQAIGLTLKYIDSETYLLTA